MFLHRTEGAFCYYIPVQPHPAFCSYVPGQSQREGVGDELCNIDYKLEVWTLGQFHTFWNFPSAHVSSVPCLCVAVASTIG